MHTGAHGCHLAARMDEWDKPPAISFHGERLRVVVANSNPGRSSFVTETRGAIVSEFSGNTSKVTIEPL